ncbi:Bacterial transcriptional activator domain protein [compost metagenome]
MVQRDLREEAWSKAELRLDTYLTLYPLNEEMHQMLIDIYAKSGKKERIAKHYTSFKALYLRELGIEPSKEMSNSVAAYLN